MINIDLPRRDESPVSIFNPLSKNLQIEYRRDDNSIEVIIVPSMEISTFPKYKADHVIKNLIRAIQDDRNVSYLDQEEEAKFLREISINEHR